MTSFSTPCKPGVTVTPEPSRRGFLKRVGILVVGFNAAGPARKLFAQSPTNPSGLVDATKVDSWVTIADDESVATSGATAGAACTSALLAV